MKSSFVAGALGRRPFLGGIAGGALAAAFPAIIAMPAAATPQEVDAAVRQVLAGRTPKAGRVKLEVQFVVEDGSSVPIALTVDSPMMAKNHVKTVHLFAEGNPRPELGAFHFTPRSGKAWVSIRARLAKSQNIVAVAEMSDGTVYMAKTEVKVTIGGCGG